MNLSLGQMAYTFGILAVGFAGIMLMRLAKSKVLRAVIMMGVLVIMGAILLLGVKF